MTMNFLVTIHSKHPADGARDIGNLMSQIRQIAQSTDSGDSAEKRIREIVRVIEQAKRGSPLANYQIEKVKDAEEACEIGLEAFHREYPSIKYEVMAKASQD